MQSRRGPEKVAIEYYLSIKIKTYYLDIGKMITKSANPSPSDQLTIVPAIQVLSIVVRKCDKLIYLMSTNNSDIIN